MNTTINLEVGDQAPGNNGSATTAFSGISDLANFNILVKGTFTLDKTMSFSQCRVFFAPGANMITSGNVNLVALESIFGPCGENTWGGITINSLAAIQFQDCGIIGAINGLIFKTGYRASQSHLIGNSFSRNGNGILCDDAGAVMRFTDFFKNHFFGAGFLPGTATRPRTGISVANCTAFIGTVFDYDVHDEFEGFYSLWSNEFRNFFLGIEGSNATIRVSNCGFYQIRPTPDAMGKPTGCGIKTNNSKLYVTAGSYAGSTIGYCDFENCAYAGINAIITQTNINLAQFRGSQYFGITSTSTNKRFQRVSKCKLTLSEPSNLCGISIERPGNIGTPTVWILEDTIDMINPGITAKLSGIEIRCPNVSTGNLAQIEKNQISLSGNTAISYGIIVYGNATNNFRINQNHCTAGSGSGFDFGIFLSDGSGTGHQLNNNISEGLYTCNFHVQKFRNASYCDNTCDQADNGFHFQGDNLGTVWSVNHLGGHSNGLLIDDMDGSSGKIGPQTRKGNMWQADDSQYSDKAATCLGDASKSRFFIEEDNNKILFPTKTLPALGWFTFEEGALKYCASSGGDLVSNFERDYAIGALPPGYLSAPEAWEISRGLIKALLQNPSAMTGDAALQYYYNQNLTSTAGRFAQAQVLLESVPFMNTTHQAQLASLLTQQETIADNISTLMHRTTMPSIVSGFYSSTNPTLDSLVQQWVAVSGSISTLLDAATLGFQSHLGTVLTALQNIPVSLPYETGWKTVKIREIKDMMGITPSTFDSIDMVNIAYANQSQYGAAARQAWQYMPDCERLALVAPNESNTVPRSASEEQINSSLVTSAIRLQPNPASNEVRVILPEPMTGQWSLVNASGNIVRAGQWQSNATDMSIEIAELPSGLYFYVFRPNHGDMLVQKLIIAR